MTKKKLRKHSGLVIFLYNIFEDSTFTVVKRDADFLSERGTICQLKI